MSSVIPCAGGLWPSSECGYGYCDTRVGQCVCQSGWSGRSDIVGAPIQDCNINAGAVTALWACVAAALVCYLSFAVSVFPPIDRKFRENWFKSPAFRSPYLLILCGCCWMVLAIVKLVGAPDEMPLITKDFVATLFFGLGASFFYFAAANNVWMWSLAATTASAGLSRSEAEQPLKRLRRAAWVYMTLAAANNAILFVTYAHPEYQEKVGQAFYLARGSIVIVYGVIERVYCTRLLKLLGESLEHHPTPAISRLQTAIRAHLSTANWSALFVAITSFVPGIWPYARTLGAYFVPSSCILVSLGSIRFLRTLPAFKSDPPSSPTTPTGSSGHPRTKSGATTPRYKYTQSRSPVMTDSGSGAALTVSGTHEHVALGVIPDETVHQSSEANSGSGPATPVTTAGASPRITSFPTPCPVADGTRRVWTRTLCVA